MPGERRAELLSDLNALVCRSHIDVAVKLSVTLPDVASDVPCVVSNVHGVRPDFLAVTLTITLTLTLTLTLTF